MEEFIQLFFNNISPQTFLFTYLCFAAGFTVFHYITVNKAVKNHNNATPTRFDLWYYLEDNFGNIILFNVIAYLSIRFTPEILSLAGMGNVFEQYSGTPFAFVGLGFCYEKLNKALRKAAYKNK